jgi:hypothetical protein
MCEAVGGRSQSERSEALLLLRGPRLMAAERDVLLFTYFTTDRQSIHLAYSLDGLRFVPLNNNQPVLRAPAALGAAAAAVRDPYLARAPASESLFYLLATSDAWSTSGTKIHVWNLSLEGHSPVWSPHSLLPVMAGVGGTRQAWAPEFLYEPSNASFLVHFSSEVRSYSRGTKRTWGVWTRDFRTLVGEPYLVFDPGHDAIDTTFARLPNGSLLPLFKDERVRTGGEHFWSSGSYCKAPRRTQSPLLPLHSAMALLTDRTVTLCMCAAVLHCVCVLQARLCVPGGPLVRRRAMRRTASRRRPQRTLPRRRWLVA